MTQFLPPQLLALFAPREPIPYLPPPDKLPHEKKNVHNYQGLAQFVQKAGFEDPKDTPPPVKVETREERRERKQREKEEQAAYKLEQEIALWDPNGRDNSTSDPFKTLFVGRINYYTTESKIKREFEAFGPIKKIQMVTDPNTEKPRGYCFIEYEHERDMHSAYKKADGMKIDGKRVLVDVERGRTVKGWLPRRLGGGLGGTRRGGVDVNVRVSGREDGYGSRSHRSRSRDRGERRRSRSRSRGGDRRRRRSRSRSSRERKRPRRSRSRDRKRSRSKDKKRSRRSSRSRSRDRSKSKRDRKDRDRDRGRDDNGDWDDDVKVKEEMGEEGEYGYDGVAIKQEMEDQKPSVDGNGEYYDDTY